jgi:integrase
MQTTLAWVPLIALFTGARSGEICQLRPEDIREESGIPYFNIAEEVTSQSVKTEAGVRHVPVHSMLIASGFLEYVAFVRDQGEAKLFPRLKPGGRDGKLNAYFGKRFHAYRVAHGITRPRVAFHSFRANVSTALEAAKVPQHEAAQVIGHERKGMTYGRYSAGLGITELREVVERIAYVGINLHHLKGSGRN